MTDRDGDVVLCDNCITSSEVREVARFDDGDFCSSCLTDSGHKKCAECEEWYEVTDHSHPKLCRSCLHEYRRLAE